MSKVGMWDAGRVSREVLYTRKAVQDGMRLTGASWLVRRTWTLQEVERGAISRCPACYDPITNHASNSRCPVCYGTGYDGGYKPVELVRILVTENQPYDIRPEKAGSHDVFNVNVKMACEPIYHNGDVFAEVLEMTGTKVSLVGRMFKLDGAVKAQTLQGVTSSNNVEMTTNWQRMLISQSGTGKLLPGTDLIVEDSQKFWGAPCDLREVRDIEIKPETLRNSDSQDGTKWQSLPEWP